MTVIRHRYVWSANETAAIRRFCQKKWVFERHVCGCSVTCNLFIFGYVLKTCMCPTDILDHAVVFKGTTDTQADVYSIRSSFPFPMRHCYLFKSGLVCTFSWRIKIINAPRTLLFWFRPPCPAHIRQVFVKSLVMCLGNYNKNRGEMKDCCEKSTSVGTRMITHLPSIKMRPHCNPLSVVEESDQRNACLSF